MKALVDLIRSSQSIILTTHKQCDGDGLGSELALYHALKPTKSNTFIINVDATAKKYRFLTPEKYIQIYETDSKIPEVDLALVFDTNDQRLVEPLFSELRKKAKKIIFIDHHPIIATAPSLEADSYIDESAASTGELAYSLIQLLQLPISNQAATALYTSITFDTQLYRFIRNSSKSHLIAAHLIDCGAEVDQVHRHLFAHQTVSKMQFLARALNQIEYLAEGRIAFLHLKKEDLKQFNLEPDESRDVIDMLMNIETLEAAALVREDSVNEFKVSLRSKGLVEVLKLAETIGGGGHRYASGASFKGPIKELKASLLPKLEELIAKHFNKKYGT